MKKRIFATLFAVVMVLALAMPTVALGIRKAEPVPKYHTPEGYNDNDYQKTVAFLEIEDVDGVKNGAKINVDYDPGDPETWHSGDEYGILWTDSSEKGVCEIRLYEGGFVGVLDVSNCAALEYLNCSDNALTEINASDCTALKSLLCSYNALTELDVSNDTALEELECYDNNLTELDVTDFTALEYLNCDNNALTELDVSYNTALVTLGCGYNALTELDVSNNILLSHLYCTRNSITELDVSNNTALEFFSCGENALTELDVSNNAAIYNLYCSYNALTELDISNNIAIKYLFCSCNELTELDVTNNIALECLYCEDNKLAELDISNNTALVDLMCYGNALYLLDLSSNPYLTLDSIRSEGNGYIGYWYENMEGYIENASFGYLFASPVDNAEFKGFFNQNDELITEGEWIEEINAFIYRLEGAPVDGSVTARFGEAEMLPGDTDGDGTVTISDALMTMRGAMGIAELSSEQLTACDVNHDGTVDMDDALLILRFAMGLIPSL